MSPRPANSALVAALLASLPALPLSAQESDLIDARQLEERGVILESPAGGRSTMRAAQGVGDVDGDGFDDIVVTVNEERGASRWAAVLVRGRPGLQGRHALDSSFPDAVFFGVQEGVVTGRAREVLPLGDLDGDGLADFLFGYDRYVARPDWAIGAAVLVYGDREFPERVDVESIGGEVRGVVFSSSDPTYRAIGANAAMMDDFNGDGRPDLAIAAPFSDPLGRNSAGTVFILFDIGDLPPLVDLAETGEGVPGLRIHGPFCEIDSCGRAIAHFGLGLEAAGDVDGDGLSDLLATANELRRRAHPCRRQPK